MGGGAEGGGWGRGWGVVGGGGWGRGWGVVGGGARLYVGELGEEGEWGFKGEVM